MKVFLKDVIIKKILIVLVTIIMVSNFIMPNYVCAKADPGETLVSGFFYLLSYVGDACMSIMQEIMIGDGDIESGGEYFIKYSPGVIFSDEVAGLKINFVTAKQTDGKTTYLGVEADNKDEFLNILERLGNAGATKTNVMSVQQLISSGNSVQLSYIGEFTKSNKSSYFFLSGPKMQGLYMRKAAFVGFDAGGGYDDDGAHSQFTSGINSDTNYALMWILNNKLYVLESKDPIIHVSAERMVDGYTTYDSINDLSNSSNDFELLSMQMSNEGGQANGFFERQELIKVSSGNIYSYDLSVISNDAVFKESVAYELQSNVSTWYTALRMIALVGLLSVLVYLGIRIILSSASAQDKAKYKNMLKDWLVAICLLFVLHYIMTFMLTFTTSINEVIKANVIKQSADGNNYDELISTVRNNYTAVANAGDVPMKTAGYTVMYLALVILTGVFTIQYLKRVIFMSFLTIIAPMIALTYPLDKVKDGKAQAFSYWVREYIFNCLIQPVHLMIYTIFITNAIDFATTNILYSIVALAFMVPAEKIIKEMFGMKSSSPSGTLGAAAGGALVMSMINKLKAKPPKDDAGSGGASSSGVRTANQPGTAGGAAGNQGGSNGGGSNGGGSNGGGSNGGGSNGGGSNGGGSNGGGSNGGGSNGGGSNGGGSNGGGSNTGGSGGTTIPDMLAPGTPTGLTGSPVPISGSKTRGFGDRHIKGVNTVVSGAGRFVRGAGGAGLAVLAGTAALAAQVADGDLFDNPEKALGQTLGAAAVGYAAGSNLTGQAMNLGGKAKDWIEKGALGIEAYNNREFDRKFYQSDGYKMIAQDDAIIQNCRNNNVSVAHAVQSFLDSGITDSTKIREALKNNIGGEEYNAFNNAGIDSVDKMSKLEKEGITADVYKQIFKNNGIDDASKILDLKKKYSNMSNNDIANRMAIAKNAPSGMKNFVPWAKAKFGMTDVDAENLYNQIVDFF